MTVYTLQDQYAGCAAESVYATGIPAARFFEYESETFQGKYARIESSGIRAGTRVERTDRWAVNFKGADGELKTEILDSGFGLLFWHMLGSYSAGTATGGWTPYTFQVGPLVGLSQTWQVGRVDVNGGMNPYTYEGGKVRTWELSNDVDGVLKFAYSLDFARETIGAGSGAYAQATPA